MLLFTRVSVGFFGRKKIEWLVAPVGDWTHGGLTVRVKPEIALSVKSTPQVVKLWLKDDPSLNMRRARVIHELMYQTLPACEEGLRPTVLDVRRSKPFVSDGSAQGMAFVLRAQAQAFLSLYREVASSRARSA